jgi:hypothetical protein
LNKQKLEGTGPTTANHCELNKRQLVGIEELRADRDARIAALRKEIDDLSRKYETVEN